ncbi:LysM peptidoglycan-binding domain-containing protein [Niallia sp. XMNu-256]|uniref:LysM peptidoglycan-binding domain-containing protein n=1 Tax=Niallia sp. XMNu-256 TaxID=3082444 RepID=UPI0030D01E3C
MSHGNQSYLRFSLEESVWFQKGQEVDDLLSISLDPDITIQESDQYITIKGSLELTGEYNREEISVIEEDEDFDFFNKNPRSVQLVELREDEGIYAFTHQFPVEVTIPKNRIRNLDAIDVTVETFDYAFPEKSCLRLTADLMIIGLYGEQQQFHEEEEPVEVEIDGIEEIEEVEDHEPVFRDDLQGFAPYERPESEIPEIDINQVYKPYEEERITEDLNEEVEAFSKPEIPDEIDEEYEPFEVEARKTPPEEEKVEEFTGFQSFEEKYPEISLIQDENNREESIKAEAKTPELEIPDQGPSVEESPVLEETVYEEPRKETPIVEAPILQEEVKKEAVPEITFTPQQNVEEQPVVEAESPEENEEMLEHEEEPAPTKGKKKPGKKLKNKQSITLSEFFARKDEEELTKLRMCIVQNGDTLEVLSERYEVPVTQIQRVNQMELNQDIYEGQVLYIPVPQSQR